LKKNSIAVQDITSITGIVNLHSMSLDEQVMCHNDILWESFEQPCFPTNMLSFVQEKNYIYCRTETTFFVVNIDW